MHLGARYRHVSRFRGVQPGRGGRGVPGWRHALHALLVLALFSTPFATAAPSPTIELGVDGLRELPSEWRDYFGIHNVEAGATAELHVGTVRGYDGPNIRLVPTEPGGLGRRAVPGYRNPFGNDVGLNLADAKSASGSARGLDRNIPEIIQNQLTAIYQTSATPAFIARDKFDKGLAYALIRAIHETFPAAADHVMLQWGNEINNKHLGVPDPPERKKGKHWAHVNRPMDAAFYAENYLAPALEALRAASMDLYGAPDRITALSGSFANISNPEFRAWMYSILDHVIAGTNAPTLKGRPVWDPLDIVTVHYPFGAPIKTSGAVVLQEIWDRYGANGRIKGLWVTEEHGKKGDGGPTIVGRSMAYLTWVARNGLNSSQTRLSWWLDNSSQRSAHDAMKLLGERLDDGRLRIAHVTQAGLDAYLVERRAVADGAVSYLVAVAPQPKQRVPPLLEFHLSGIEKTAAWEASAIQYSADKTAAPANTQLRQVGNDLDLVVENIIGKTLVITLLNKKS